MALTNLVTSLVLDVYDHDTTPTSVKAIALDKQTRFIKATLTYRGADYPVDENATVTLTVIRPDKTGVQETGSVVDVDNADRTGTTKGVYAELSQTALAVKGNLKAQFMVAVGDQILRTEIFTIKNGEALDADVSEWAGEYQGYNLDELVQSVNSAVATVGEMESDVSDLKEGLSSIPSIKTPDDETEADLYICDSNGYVLAKFEDGHIKTKNFDSTEVGTDMVKEASKTEADLYICDSFGNVIAEFKDGHIVTKKFDSADFVNVPSNVESLLADVSALKSATSGIVYRNMDATDGVYASCRWHQPNATKKQFCLLMGADVHEDTIRMNSMVEYLNAVDAFDAGIMLGDIGAWEKDATWYTEAISKTNKPFLTVVGNHDAAGNMSLDSTSYEYLSDFYDKFIAPNIQYADLTQAEHPNDTVYYYKDFTEHKIRLICVNQYDYPPDKNGDTFVYSRGANCYSQAQITWLCNTLMSTPSDYGVIIAMHSFPAPVRVKANDTWVSSTWHYSGPADIMDHTQDGYIITEIVDAWMNGTALSKTYGYIPTGSWTSVVVNVDFSSRGTGEFITYIGGHWHMSITSEMHQYPNQKMYSVDCTGLNASTQGDTPRRAGTRSEDAICALAVDRDSKTVKLFRIGAHFTKNAIDRLYGKYSYATE